MTSHGPIGWRHPHASTAKSRDNLLDDGGKATTDPKTAESHSSVAPRIPRSGGYAPRGLGVVAERNEPMTTSTRCHLRSCEAHSIAHLPTRSGRWNLRGNGDQVDADRRERSVKCASTASGRRWIRFQVAPTARSHSRCGTLRGKARLPSGCACRSVGLAECASPILVKVGQLDSAGTPRELRTSAVPRSRH